MKLTKFKKKMLVTVRDNPGIGAGVLAAIVWPDSNMHRRVSNQGNGACRGKAAKPATSTTVDPLSRFASSPFYAEAKLKPGVTKPCLPTSRSPYYIKLWTLLKEGTRTERHRQGAPRQHQTVFGTYGTGWHHRQCESLTLTSTIIGWK